MEFPHGSQYPRAQKTDCPPKVHQIQTPTPFEGVPTVNSYLIEDPLTLVDCGLNTPQSWKMFEAHLEKLGYQVKDIQRILVTHAHPDHFGFAERVRHISDAKIYIGEKEQQMVVEEMRVSMDKRRPAYRDFFLRLGFAADTFQAMLAMAEMVRAIAQPVKDAIPLAEGEKIEFEDYTLETMHVPGHTYGIVCYWEPQKKFMFSNDHLLQETSPNPTVELGPEGEQDYEKKFRSLCSYYEQVKRVGKLDLSCVLPGHGLPFVGHQRVIETLMYFYDKRQQKIWDALRETGPINVSELAGHVFPRAKGMQHFLAGSELLGNLEVLEDMNAVARSFDGEHYLYEAIGERPFQG